MNPTDDLDRRIERWFTDTAPSAAPTQLLDETLARTSAAGQRGGGGWAATAAKALAALAVLAIAVAVGFGAGRLVNPEIGQEAPSPAPSTAVASPTAEPTPSPSAAATSPTETQTPTVTATPSPTPDPDDVLLSLVPRCDVTPSVVAPTDMVMEDGRFVWSGQGPDDPYQRRVRQLSATGLATVRARIAEIGLLDSDADYTFERREGAPEPQGRGFCVFTFEHRDRGVDVTVTSANWFGDEYEATYLEPDPERHVLDDFARQLADPEAWLSPADWADASASPFLADSFLVLGVPNFFDEPGPDVEELAWPFPEPPSAFGEAAGDAGDVRCAAADRAAIEAFLAGQMLPGGEPIDLAAPMFQISVREGGASYTLTIWPKLPGGRPGCDDVRHR